VQAVRGVNGQSFSEVLASARQRAPPSRPARAYGGLSATVCCAVNRRQRARCSSIPRKATWIVACSLYGGTATAAVKPAAEEPAAEEPDALESGARPSVDGVLAGAAGSSGPSGFARLDGFYGWVGIHSGIAWLGRSAARQYRIGRSAPTFYVSLGMGFFDLVTLSTSLGALFPKDHASYEEDVVPLYRSGPVTSAKSSLEVTNYAMEIGLRTPSFCIQQGTGNNCVALHAFVNYGRAWFSAERSIESCTDCSTQSIDLPAGSLLEPGLAFGIPSREKVGLDVRTSYRYFLGNAGPASELRLGLAILFL